MEEELVTVASYHSPVEAHMAMDMLASRGIQAFVSEENISYSVPFGVVQVRVAPQDATRAAAIIAAIDEQRKAEPVAADGDGEAEEDSSASPMAALRYTLDEGLCDPQYLQGLRVHIDEVLGSAPVVAPGETYLVRGDYDMQVAHVAWLRLSGLGRSYGRAAPLYPGAGKFEVTAKILHVVPGRQSTLDLLLADKEGADLGVRVRITLEGIA
jgi:hypothetical protein